MPLDKSEGVVKTVLQKAARAIPRALKGNWRDVKTLFEFAGIYPAKDNSSATDPWFMCCRTLMRGRQNIQQE